MAHTHLQRFGHKDTPLPFPLGRHIQHDSQSRMFTFQVPPTPLRYTTVLWPHSTPVLDQGKKNACTGDAMAQLLNCDMFASVRRTVKALPGVELAAAPWLTQGDALAIYSLGTHYDGFGPSQYYPPHDDGGTGLGVAKAAQQLGYIDRYLHCYTFAQFQAAIQTQPVLVGSSWTDSMFDPDPNGRISVGPLNDTTVVGGHEWVGMGINYQTLEVTGFCAWGARWGGGVATHLPQGMFTVSFADFQALLADSGDIIVPHGIGMPG